MSAETSSSRLRRLLLLVPWLKANPGITIAEAAEAHSVSTEQMMSDLAELYTTEIPGMFSEGMLDIAYWRSDYSVDGDCRIFVREARRLDRPTRLASEQVSQLIIAIDAARVSLGEATIHLDSARAKLASLLTPDMTAPTRAVHASRASADSVVAAVTAAMDSNKPVLIEYLSGNGDAVTSRVIEPISLNSVADRVHIQAWCQSASDWRTFRVDRVIAVSECEAATQRPATDAPPLPNIFAPEFAVEVRVRVAAGSRWVVEDLPGVDITSRDDGSCDAVFRAGSHDWVARWALRYAGRVVLLEPQAALTLAEERAHAALQLMSEQPVG